MKRLIFGSSLTFLTASAILAQDASPTPEINAGALAACAGIGLIVPLISLGIWLWIAIWIMKDSARRQSPNRTLVVVLGWLVPVIGLIVHLATRPKTIPGGPAA
jgi:hypothetical protein